MISEVLLMYCWFHWGGGGGSFVVSFWACRVFVANSPSISLEVVLVTVVYSSLWFMDGREAGRKFGTSAE